MLDAVASDEFPELRPFMDARGYEPGQALHGVPPGVELTAIREAAVDVRDAIISTGRPDAVTTCDLITFAYPTRFALWRAAISPAPFVWMTNRMLVVQWTDPRQRRRTLLWEPTDHERGEHTPYVAALKQRSVVPDRLLTRVHGTVLGHLRVLGIDPADVDYVAFDHLHGQDVRRLLGTTLPSPDLGAPDEPLAGWLPNARMITQVREWDTIRHLHPLQVPWYQPWAYEDLPPESLLFVDGDVHLGPGVALLYTPGHTAGSQTLTLHTDRGVWVSSANGVAAESWTPRASRIPGVRRWCSDWGQEVVLNASTLEFAAWQYDSMVAEALVADPTSDGDFRLTFPSSELTAHRLSPLTTPTLTHGAIRHGTVRPSPVHAAP
ncbi:MAG: hypothetical protein M3N57_04665 [Actinomycetota bacterium]|nr:hypothetical protein [Actinomycetota bacterium]